MTLAETQALFHALATRDPSAPQEDIERCFRGSPDLPAAERVEIYANMYLWRLVDALREDYPKLAAVLGDERFFALGEAYARAHPSEHHDVARFGRHLAAFLRTHPDPERPDVADLATLEWARTEVFFEAPAIPVGRAPFAALSPEAFLEARLRLVPALRILVLEHDAPSLWRNLEMGEAPEPPRPGPTAVTVWRSGFDVFHTTLDLDEAVALESVARGEPLARVCAAFGRRERPAEAAFAALSSWVDEGWVSAVDTLKPGG